MNVSKRKKYKITMTQFTGVIEDFMNLHEDFINELILNKIKEQIVLNDVDTVDIQKNEVIHQKLELLKKHLTRLCKEEFDDWEISMDLDSFEKEFNKHFKISKEELESNSFLK